MKTVLKVALGVILGLTVLIVGCSALFSSAVDEVEKDSQKNAKTVQEIRKAHLGDTRADIESRLGKPASTQESTSTSDRPDDGIGDSYIYYPVKGGEILDTWQLVFDGDKLIARNKN
jgi:hypothetical protein